MIFTKCPFCATEIAVAYELWKWMQLSIILLRTGNSAVPVFTLICAGCRTGMVITMKKYFTVCAIVVAVLILLTGCRNEQVPHFTAEASITVDPGTLERIRITLPEEISRESISDIQDDFVLNDQQVGGIVLVDIPKELLDSPMKGLFEITELLRQQLMPDIPAKEVEVVSWGGSQNAYMELAVGPDDITYFHYLFRGTNNTYDVWFNWKLLNQDSDIIYEIVNSVAGEDILQENNQNPF